MSIRLLPDEAPYECSMCSKVEVAAWRNLANRGWRSHHAGDLDPIRLCRDCATIIANRRAASCGL